jgi:hypothetical protein
MTETTTSIFGTMPLLDELGLEAKWYTKNQMRTAMRALGIGFGISAQDINEGLAETDSLFEPETSAYTIEGSTVTWTQEGVTTQAARLPPHVDLLEYATLIKSSNDKVRIWGWAKNGLVAYSSGETLDPNAGDVHINFVIFDFVSDKIIDSLKMHSAADFDNADATVQALYCAYMSRIRGLLSRYGIAELQLGFMPLPIKNDGAVYSARAVTTLLTEEEQEAEWYRGKVKSYSIVVGKNDAKSVTIMSKDEASATEVEVCGYFLSPFENRALIVISEYRYGVSNMPSSTEYIFSGCHLDEGFE